MDTLSRAVLLLVVLCALLPAAAAEEPNFTGVWVMDLEKSDFGSLPKPDSARYAIRHTGAKLLFDYTQDGAKSRVSVTIDGQERITDSEPDRELWTRAYWAGPVLVLEARQRPRTGQDVPVVKWTSRWSLSDQGRTFTIQRRITADETQVDQILVFRKQ